jgi:hypothetical protein
METLKDVETSTQKQAEIPNIDFQMASIAKAATPSKGADYVILKLEKGKKRGRVYIDGTDDVFNPETKKTERIRLLNGVAEIWQSKQKDIDKDYILKNRRSLMFEKNICRIDKRDTAAMEWWKVSNCNIENPNRIPGKRQAFYEYNPAKAQKALLEKKTLGLEMAMMVKDMDYEKVKMLALFFGVSLIDELAQPKSPDGVRMELMLIANNSPESFREKLDSEEVKLQFAVRSAIVSGKLQLGKKPNEVHFGNGTFVCKMPSGASALRYLTELAMTNTEEGRKFKENLQNLK